MGVFTWSEVLKESAEADKQYQPLPVAEYDFIITEAEGAVNGNGNHVYTYTAKVETGEYAGKFLKRQKLTFVPDNPAAMPWFFKKMAALGLDTTFFKSEPGDDVVAAAMVGKRFLGKIKHRKYQGQDGDERTAVDVESYKPARGAGAPGVGAAPAAAPPPAAAPAPAPAAPPAAPPVAAPAPAAAPAPVETAAPPAGAPPVASVQAPAVEQPTAAPAPAPTLTPQTETKDPWSATPPVMPGLGNDAF